MATVNQLKIYYAKLLILQYLGQPKAVATIKAIAEPLLMNLVALDVENGFDIDTAVGVQLDTIAKYLDVTRNGAGFNGVTITLDDEEFRSLIKMAAIVRSAGSSLYDIQTLLQVFFAGQIFVFDNAQMQLSYWIFGSVGSLDLIEMFVVQGLLPKPMGVALSSIVYVDFDQPLFGYRTYKRAAGQNVVGYNTYDDYDPDKRWLSYKDTIEV